MLEKKLNAEAWDYEAKRGNFWTRPVNDEDVLSARNGKILVRLTPSRFVKESWVKGTKGSRMLLLASAGGQQSVLFSAYGADITSIDISKEQIRRDEETLEKYGLEGRTIVGSCTGLERRRAFPLRLCQPGPLCFRREEGDEGKAQSQIHAPLLR